MTVVFYDGLAEKKTEIQKALALGQSLVHDDFIDSNSNPTDGTKGRLTFEIIIADQTEFNIVKTLKQKAESDTLSQADKDDIIKRVAKLL